MARIIESSTQRQAAISISSLWQNAILGILLGLLFWVLSALLKSRFNIGDTAGDIATILVAAVGILMMIKLSMIRPLAVVVAVAVSLWGLNSWTSGLGWGEIMMWDVILYVLAYMSFSWVVRNRQFMSAAFAILAIIVTVRIIASL